MKAPWGKTHTRPLETSAIVHFSQCASPVFLGRHMHLSHHCSECSLQAWGLRCSTQGAGLPGALCPYRPAVSLGRLLSVVSPSAFLSQVCLRSGTHCTTTRGRSIFSLQRHLTPAPLGFSLTSIIHWGVGRKCLCFHSCFC